MGWVVGVVFCGILLWSDIVLLLLLFVFVHFFTSHGKQPLPLCVLTPHKLSKNLKMLLNSRSLGGQVDTIIGSYHSNFDLERCRAREAQACFIIADKSKKNPAVEGTCSRCCCVLLYCCTVVLLYCCCALPLLCIAGLTLLLLFARRKRHFGWFGISQFEFGRFFVSECHHSSIFGTCSLGDWGSGRSFECFLFEATGRLLLPWFATALWYLNTRKWTTHLFLFSCLCCLFVCSGGTRLWRPTLFVPVPVHCCRICCEARHCNL